MKSQPVESHEEVYAEKLSATSVPVTISFPCVKIIYVLTGICEIRFSDDSIGLFPNEIILFNKDDYSLSMSSDATLLCFYIGIDFYKQFVFHEIWQDPFFSEFIMYFFDKQQRSFSFGKYTADSTNNLTQLLHGLYQELTGTSRCAGYAADYYTFLIFIQFARQYQYMLNGKTNYSKQLDYPQLMRYMNTNYRTLTLADTAAHFNFSPAYISRFLKKTTGQSFMECLHAIRMNAAAHILRHADIPVDRIAPVVGYQNVSFFYRVFRRHFGCTPTEYRASHS